MFTLLYNALKLLNRLPGGDSGKTLADFMDGGEIESWAIEALTFLVKSGVVEGSDGCLNPNDTATRAEMAQLFYNLLGR